MKKEKQNKIKILRLKLLKEDLNLAKIECTEGDNNLKSMLNKFRKRIKKNSLERFDKNILNINYDKSNNITCSISKTNSLNSKLCKNDQYKHPQWIKSIYKRI